MRKVTATLLLLLMGFLFGRLSLERQARAGRVPGAEADCAPGTVNGNVNGDEAIDIADAVYLLNYLFVGGPMPCDNRRSLEAELAACRKALADCKGEPQLTWFTTCGDPVCQGYTGPFADIPVCTDQREGESCEVEGDRCDLEDGCNGLLVCAKTDPKADGCPISRRDLKEAIQYLSDAEKDRARDQLLDLRIASWRYKSDASTGKLRLGFIIDDAPDSPAVRPDGERVDLYGYTSMAVAAIQSQQRQLTALGREVAALRLRSRVE